MGRNLMGNVWLQVGIGPAAVRGLVGDAIAISRCKS